MAGTWRRAEELGFTGGWVYDHLAWRGHTPWDDAYASLAAAAAVTSRIRLGTLVTSANFRTPVPTASAIRTIDRISGGRLTLGIGAGGSAHTSDGDVLDRDWTPRERADRFEEWVTQLDALLTGESVSATGEYWSARGRHHRSRPGAAAAAVLDRRQRTARHAAGGAARAGLGRQPGRARRRTTRRERSSPGWRRPARPPVATSLRCRSCC